MNRENTELRGSENECSLCGAVFAGLELFDVHQDVDYDRPHGKQIICLRPEDLRMDKTGKHPVPVSSERASEQTLIQDDRGTWNTPAGLKNRQRSASQLSRARFERETV